MTEEKDNTILRRQTGTTIPSKRRKKKKLRKLPFVILIIVVLLIAMITYVVHGYQSGMKYAQEHAKDIKIHKFNGAVKNDGKITVLMPVSVLTKLMVENQELTLLWLYSMTILRKK